MGVLPSGWLVREHPRDSICIREAACCFKFCLLDINLVESDICRSERGMRHACFCCRLGGGVLRKLPSARQYSQKLTSCVCHQSDVSQGLAAVGVTRRHMWKQTVILSEVGRGDVSENNLASGGHRGGRSGVRRLVQMWSGSSSELVFSRLIAWCRRTGTCPGSVACSIGCDGVSDARADKHESTPTV